MNKRKALIIMIAIPFLAQVLSILLVCLVCASPFIALAYGVSLWFDYRKKRDIRQKKFELYQKRPTYGNVE